MGTESFTSLPPPPVQPAMAAAYHKAYPSVGAPPARMEVCAVRIIFTVLEASHVQQVASYGHMAP